MSFFRISQSISEANVLTVRYHEHMYRKGLPECIGHRPFLAEDPGSLHGSFENVSLKSSSARPLGET